jgi:hypothetical protein
VSAVLLSLHHARAAEHKGVQPTARSLRLRSGFRQRFIPSVWQHTSRAGRGSHFHTRPIPGEVFPCDMDAFSRPASQYSRLWR